MLGGNIYEKQVNYKVNGEEWKEAKDKAFNKLVKKVKIDGFREGKVPRNVLKRNMVLETLLVRLWKT